MDPVFRYGDPEWRLPRRYEEPPEGQLSNGYDETFRTCSHCGSIHPEDLLAVVAAGAEVHGSDWKYGWPHKFYIEGVANPRAGEPTPITWRYPPASSGEAPTITRLPAPATMHARWYNAHLLDQGFDDEAFAALLDVLKRSGVEWFRDADGEIKYRAPHHGYQQ